MVRKNSYVDDEWKNKRAVLTLRYPLSTVQPRIGTTPERSRSRDCLRQRYGKSGVDSRTAATENRTTATEKQSGLRLMPWNQDIFQRELHEMLFPSCQQAQGTSWQCRRSLTKSISEEMPYFTGLTVTRSPAWNARRTRVATESRSRQKRHVSYENTAATAAVQCHVQDDGLSLRGRPTPSPQESVEEGCGLTHYFDCETTTTVHVRQQPLAQPHQPRAKELTL